MIGLQYKPAHEEDEKGEDPLLDKTTKRKEKQVKQDSSKHSNSLLIKPHFTLHKYVIISLIRDYRSKL